VEALALRLTAAHDGIGRGDTPRNRGLGIDLIRTMAEQIRAATVRGDGPGTCLTATAPLRD
jgi:two-component sensor histidine kinase